MKWIFCRIWKKKRNTDYHFAPPLYVGGKLTISVREYHLRCSISMAFLMPMIRYVFLIPTFKPSLDISQVLNEFCKPAGWVVSLHCEMPEMSIQMSNSLSYLKASSNDFDFPRFILFTSTCVF